MPTAEKVAEVELLAEKLGAVKSLVLADYRGLNVKSITQLRRELRAAGVEFRVAKNTLTRLAAQKAGVSGLDGLLEGPTALAFGTEDPVAPAKALSDFAKQNKALQIKGGWLTGAVIDAAGVQALADLPSREVLLAQVARGFQAPLAGLANVLQGTIRNVVYALDAVRVQKEAAG